MKSFVVVFLIIVVTVIEILSAYCSYGHEYVIFVGLFVVATGELLRTALMQRVDWFYGEDRDLTDFILNLIFLLFFIYWFLDWSIFSKCAFIEKFVTFRGLILL